MPIVISSPEIRNEKTIKRCLDVANAIIVESTSLDGDGWIYAAFNHDNKWSIVRQERQENGLYRLYMNDEKYSSLLDICNMFDQGVN